MSVCIQIKADDVMPWGKYKGLSLRAVYKKDIEYYEYLCTRENEYKISEQTRKIVEKDLPKEELSTVSYSKTKGNKKELKFSDKLDFGPFSGETLTSVYVKNPTYYRYLCEGLNYYISKKTYEKLEFGGKVVKEVVKELKKNKEFKNLEVDDRIVVQEQKKKKTKRKNITVDDEDLSIEEIIVEPSLKAREKYDLKIEQGIDECWNNLDPEKDLPNYIGERVTGRFSPEFYETVINNLAKDKYNLLVDLKAIYGSKARFHQDQDKAIMAVLEGKKTLVVQSTGWGKSLVYFLSIKKLREMGKGPAIIISPLIALMRNQIESETVEKTKLVVKEINSENKDEWKSIYASIKANEVDAVMIAPEKLDDEKFLNEMKNIIPYISLFAVDEAHCISDWGHEFRVDFRRIVKFVRGFNSNTAILATTATANDRVIRDIKFQLGKDLEVLRGDMLRANFAIDIIRFGNDYGKLCWLEKHLPELIKVGSGIIYCLRVKDCKKVAAYLCSKGFNAKAYYANLDKDEKKKTEDEFKEDKIDVLVATIAFGMGIDKNNIAFVVHYQQPAGFIAYYQQIGRAGRDDKKIPEAKAIMLVGDDDNDTNIYFITHSFPTAQELTSVIDFVTDNVSCSRDDIMDEFNWKEDKANKIIKYLRVEGYLYRKKIKDENGKYKVHYFRTQREWICDMKRSRIVSGFRWKELRDFNRFIDSRDCYMKQIRNALNDHTTEDCGKCANCRGKHFFD